LSAQASDPRIGTWKLNVAKSKYSPGPAPPALTVNVEPSGQGEKVTTEFVNADGTRTTIEYTANFDGKDYPLTGSQIADTVSLKRSNARTTVRTDKKGGKVANPQTGRLEGRKDDARHDERHERPAAGGEQRRGVREAITTKEAWNRLSNLTGAAPAGRGTAMSGRG
jgi:hypothetical protein